MTWQRRLWVWVAGTTATIIDAIGYSQCPACRRWRQDPTDYCPGCGL